MSIKITQRVDKAAIFILCLFVLISYPINSDAHSNQWQRELRNASYQDDYLQTFVITSGGKIHSIVVDAKKCQEFDTRCIWQYTRQWVGTILDELNAQKTSSETAITGLQCILSYSVYQENPEVFLFQCDGDTQKTEIRYDKLKQFLKRKFE
jgi:hypothetical protein